MQSSKTHSFTRVRSKSAKLRARWNRKPYNQALRKKNKKQR